MSSDESVGDTVVKLLGDPLRARIVWLLARERMCTCHLLEETGARQPTISHHLRVLRDAGFVTAEPYGRFTYYRLHPDPLRELGASLSDLAGQAQQAELTRRPCE